jgi:hypothetical protein
MIPMGATREQFRRADCAVRHAKGVTELSEALKRR